VGALDSALNENREACSFRLPCYFRLLSGGSDETRTRDLRRDRPWGNIVITARYANPQNVFGSVQLDVILYDSVQSVNRVV